MAHRHPPWRGGRDRRRPHHLRARPQPRTVVAAAVAGFLLAAFSGVGDVTTLTRSQVPYAFSAVAARAAVVVTMGVGFGLALAALVVFRRHPEIRAQD